MAGDAAVKFKMVHDVSKSTKFGTKLRYDSFFSLTLVDGCSSLCRPCSLHTKNRCS